MIFVSLSILCSVLLGFIFKLYGRYGVDHFQAIVVNYFTCVICGALYSRSMPIGPAVGESSAWLPYAVGLGFVFISGFNGAASTVKHFGVTVSQIMQKMSILMTVPFALLVFNESASWGKIMGILCALAAIVLVNWPQKGEAAKSTPWHLWWIPVGTWLLSGVIEMTFMWVQGNSWVKSGDVRFVTTVFFTAGCIGLLGTLVGWWSGRLTFQWRNVIGGIILGIPNFGSMYFLLLSLSQGIEGSFVFPVTNLGIILLTAMGAVVFFKEKLSVIHIFGIFVAISAILLMAFG
jgi:drug/metabolite transporter (DMT)-like permease